MEQLVLNRFRGVKACDHAQICPGKFFPVDIEDGQKLACIRKFAIFTQRTGANRHKGTRSRSERKPVVKLENGFSEECGNLRLFYLFAQLTANLFYIS